jgi:hypothetical protein
MNDKQKNAFVNKGQGYMTLSESQVVSVMSKHVAELAAKNATGLDYTLISVNSSTDNRKARPDPRVYTFRLDTMYEKQQAKRKQKAN